VPIDFTRGRWERVKETARRWWDGDLGRPLVQIATVTHDPGRPEPFLPHEFYTSAYDPSVSAGRIVDRVDYDLSRLAFHGDAFPHFMPFFGAGVLAAFMGARLDQREETCWFHPPDVRDAPDISLELDPGNRWFRRIGDIYRAGIERWEGLVQLGMTDLGGSLDVVASFLPGEKLLLGMYDHPGEIRRLNDEVHAAWWECHDRYNALLQPVNPGYTAWTPLFSEEPYYMLQCDVSFMIGPDMFGEFVLPELTRSCRRLKNAFYHLDGPGQLRHLDALLSIEELKGIQWVPGDGAPGVADWPGVYRKIRDAGKLVQVFGDIGDLDAIVGHLGGSGAGLAVICMSFDNPRTMPSEAEIVDALGRYGVGI